MNRVWHFSIGIVAGLLLVASLAHATPVAVYITITRDDAGYDLEQIRIELEENISKVKTSGYTDSIGQAVIYVEPGNYELSIRVSDSPDFVDNGKFKNQRYPLFVGSAGASQYQQIVSQERLFQVGFYSDEAKTKPLVGELITMKSGGGQNLLTLRTRTDANGIAYAGLPPGIQSSIQVLATPSGYVPIDRVESVPSGTMNHEIDIFLSTATTTLDVQLLNGLTGEPLVLPAADVAKIDCSPKDQAEGLPVKGEVISGQSTAMLPAYTVLRGFHCTGFISNLFEVQDYVIDSPVDDGDTVIVRLHVFPVDGVVEFTFADIETGEEIREPTYEVTLVPVSDTESDTNIGHIRRKIFRTNDTPSMIVPKGVSYVPTVEILHEADDGQFDSHIVLDGELEIFSLPVTADDSLSIEIPVATFDAAIQPELLDLEGNPSDGYVRIIINEEEIEEKFNQENTNDQKVKDDHEIFAVFRKDTPISIPVLSGLSYQVRVGPLKESENSNLIVPGFESVKPNSGQSILFSQQLVEPNYSLTMALSAEDESGNAIDLSEADLLKCTVRTPSGQTGFGNNRENDGTMTLSVFLSKKLLKKSLRFGVSCTAIFLGEGGEKGSFYQGRIEHVTQARKKSGSDSILLQFRRRHHPEQRESFSPAEAKTFSLPGGKMRIEAGAGAFSDGSYLELSVQSSTEWQPNDLVAVTEAFKFSLSDGENLVTSFDPVNFCQEFTDEDIEALQELYGADVSRQSIFGAFYNEDTDEWEVVDTTVSGNDVCWTVDHFSIWGTLLDVLKELQESQLNSYRISRRAKNGKVLLRWDEPENIDAVGSVTYEIRYSTRVKNKKKCSALSEFSKSKTTESNKFRLRVKRAVCADVRVSGGTAPTAKKYRKVK